MRGLRVTATTSQVRAWWDPPCQPSRLTTISFGDQGARVTVDARTVPVWRQVEAAFAAHDYPIRAGDTGAYNCRRITGGTGYSLHAYGIAVDVNWSTNPYGPTLRTDMPPGAIAAIEAIRARGEQAVRWGGRYSGNKDAMHFEVVVPPDYLADLDEGGLTVADIRDLLDAEQDTRRLILTSTRQVLQSEKRTRALLRKGGAIPAEGDDESEVEKALADIDAKLEALG